MRVSFLKKALNEHPMKPKITRVTTWFAAAAFVVAAMMMTAGTAMAQKHTCAYVNDNYFDEPNAVDGYMVTGTSATYLNAVLTGGTSQEDAGYREAVTEIVLHPTKNILYVSDDLSKDIAVMKIDPDTCLLTLLGNYPVGGSDRHGIGLAISPNGEWLYAVNTTAPSLQLFDIRADGGLRASRQTIDLPDEPAGMAVSPDGTTLVLAFPGTNVDTYHVISYAIAPSVGTLAQITDMKVGAQPEEVAIDSQSKFVYVGTFKNHGEGVEQLQIGSGSTLTGVGEKTLHKGLCSSFILLSAHGKYLYVSNSLSASITTFVVGPSAGTLKYVTLTEDGPAGNQPGGLATTTNGTLLFSGSSSTPGDGAPFGIFNANSDGSLVSLGTFSIAPGRSASPSSVVARTF
jgi:6-phosphogluconolactonase (cycloisomerase 2 family)